MKALLRYPTELAISHPGKLIALYALLTVCFALFIPGIKIDTDPENMLSAEEPVRISHAKVKRDFSLYDTIVVGVVDEGSDKGVFTEATLDNIARITDEILKIDGVVASDVMGPTTTDDIESIDGVLTIDPLMEPSEHRRGAPEAVRDAALDNPILRDMLVSEDGKSIALYVPIVDKSESYRISKEIESIAQEIKGSESYYLAGLPVAEDTFGVEMFKQMAVSAPLAGLIIFILMLYFFRRTVLVASAMAVALMTVLWTMGLLIGTGFTVHIMSSMIPIFLMPIAVLDSVHILSEFHDRHSRGADRRDTIASVMDSLSAPMLFTSITSAVGFASLVFTPIPPVRVFGGFVAFGIVAAWLITITLLPAIIVLLSDKRIEGFTASGKGGKTLISFERRAASFASRRRVIILFVSLIVLGASLYGTTLTVVNDNPVKWFDDSHQVRVADTKLNEHFGGTYVSYLVFESGEPDAMKSPEVVSYIERVQRELDSIEVVGKSTSYVDVVSKVASELRGGKELPGSTLPKSSKETAQYLLLYEMSGDPNDLYHLIDPTYSSVNVWVQLRSGDNVDMLRVEERINGFIIDNPPPVPLKHSWAGLNYLNVVWQEKMVSGMLKALGGSAVVVLLMMSLLFRSFVWGVISMVPLSLTIVLIYGLVGYVGKDYDMPIAVLSALTLGISIDFAIHLCQRTRQIRAGEQEWSRVLEKVYGEPVRAILRNMAVITIGFLPLLFSSLIPYQTVGIFFAAIMAVSGVSTLIVLPALMTLFKRPLKL